ncbi:MAG TPA: hypothetical protein VGT03_01720 [Candidatus Acidoferrales bacterium]|nr:hypothetical protein [Candidatus Acidoferrales bacterium]
MKAFSPLKKAAAALVLTVGALLSASAAFGQGCALCYADAAATGPQTQAALRHGILILMIPPMILFAGLYLLLYRRRNLHRETFNDLPLAAHASPGKYSEITLHLN